MSIADTDGVYCALHCADDHTNVWIARTQVLIAIVVVKVPLTGIGSRLATFGGHRHRY